MWTFVFDFRLDLRLAKQQFGFIQKFKVKQLVIRKFNQNKNHPIQSRNKAGVGFIAPEIDSTAKTL